MPSSGGRAVRLGAAAALLLAAVAGITCSAAAALDWQGNDKLARLLSSRMTQEELAETSQKLITAKRAPDDAVVQRAREAAKRYPMLASPYFVVAAAQKLKGQRDPATRLAALAMRRDPRFIPGHYWSITDAIERDNVEAATAGTLRVFSVDPGNALQSIDLLVRLTASRRSWPLIRAALPGGVAWREVYYSKLVEAGFEPSIVFNVIDVARASSGKPPTVREQNALLTSMTGKGDFDRAYTAWLGWLPPEALGKVAYLYDGSFSGAPGALPFNWSFATSGEGAATPDKEHGLRVDYAATNNIDLATQTMLIPPGRYRLVSLGRLDQLMAQDAPVPLSWQLLCLPKRNVIAQLQLANAADNQGAAVLFDVPADCPAQTLVLRGTAMEFAIRVGGYVRSVAIDKAR